MREPMTTIQSTSIDELLTAYRESDHTELKEELIAEAADLTSGLLSNVDTAKDLLGTAYSVLAAAIDLPNCEACKYE